jgi:hypothetical protein
MGIMEKMLENKIVFSLLITLSFSVFGTSDLRSNSQSVEAQKAEETCMHLIN